MLFTNAALFLGLVGSAAAQSGPYDFDPIAGYIPRTDATEYLNKDLIQKGLEDLIGDETCASFALAEDFIKGVTAPTNYFETIPTYTTTLSEPFEEMTTYYNADDFIQIWIKAAYEKKNFQKGVKNGFAKFKTAFQGTVPPADVGKECVGFEEVLKKGLSYGAALVEMYQLMQKAIDFADQGCFAQDNEPNGGPAPCFDAVEAWDGAAAIYVGSLEGTDGRNLASGSNGKAPYALADKRCRNFRTCGPNNGENYPALNPKDVTAPINQRILGLFAAGSQAAWFGDAPLMKGYMRLISNKSAVPLIQGTYRYMYRLSNLEFGPNSYSTFDKELAEGAAFSFPILPKVWACSKKGANKMFDQTKIVADKLPVDFLSLQLALECNYKCLGITCAEVGVLYDNGSDPVDQPNVPKPGVTWCDDVDNASNSVCAKQNGARKAACQMFVGQPGVKDRQKLKFEF